MIRHKKIRHAPTQRHRHHLPLYLTLLGHFDSFLPTVVLGLAMLALLTLLALFGASSATPLPVPPPHIVLMLVDELGTGDVPWTDPDMIAPTIETLGEGGLRLGHQYTWHWCAPTRGSLLSGRLPMRNGYADGVGRPSASLLGMAGCGAGLDLKLPLIPDDLKQAPNPYATHMLGKWHVGYRSPENMPTARGFDTYLGLLGGGSDHFDKTLCVGPVAAGIGSYVYSASLSPPRYLRVLILSQTTHASYLHC